MRTCRNGHKWNPESRRQCPICQSERRKERRLRNRDEEIRYGKEWISRNKERYDLSQKEWQQRNPSYYCWNTMTQRCLNPRNTNYKHYGERGITVCERWQGKEGYRNFVKDIGERPSPKYSLNRINNDGNYESGNVEWSLHREQMRNTRRNRNVTLAGRTQCIAAWAEELGMTFASFWLRIRNGWSEERLLTPNSQPDQLRKRQLKTLKSKGVARNP